MKASDRAKQAIVWAITITGVVVFVFTFLHSTVYQAGSADASVSDISTNSAAQKKTGSVTSKSIPSSYPVRLDIPSIDVEAKVQHVGQAASGAMAVPTNYSDVGWYRGGTIPGEVGNAVIDGHVDNGLALGGVFKHLSDIRIGDDMYVTNKAGKKSHFVVTGIDVYDYSDPQAAAEVFGKTNERSLKLITCEGTWVKEDKTYSQRLIITAVLKEA